jgi:hypothetical protein
MKDMQWYLKHIAIANKMLEHEIQANLNIAAEKLRKFKNGVLCKNYGRGGRWNYKIIGIKKVEMCQLEDGTYDLRILYAVIRIDLTKDQKDCPYSQYESEMVLIKRAPKVKT